MEDIQSQMNAILSDPEMMQKLQTMAQSLNLSPGQPNAADAAGADAPPGIDIAMLQKLSGFARQSNIDNNQQTLLSALSPYLSRGRLDKLEKAMRAAKMARMASVFINSGGLKLLSGR